jgi:ubiquitin carboxyl-terminal hydrolase L3
MIPKPVLGVLFLYECTPVQTEHAHQQEASLHPEQVPHDIFFMKQYAQNACGTIGLFHIILNAAKARPEIVDQGSYLDNFRTQGLTKNA